MNLNDNIWDFKLVWRIFDIGQQKLRFYTLGMQIATDTIIRNLKVWVEKEYCCYLKWYFHKLR